MSYLIKNAKYDISGGPLDSIVVATVEYEFEKNNMFLSVVDINGIFEFHLSKDDIFELLLNEADDERVEASFISSFNNINLESLEELEDKSDDSLLIKYIIMVLRLDENEANDLVNKSKGNYLIIDMIKDYCYEDLL